MTDTSLPGFDGFALRDLLRQDRGTHDVPVVFVSDNADAAGVEHAADAGANLVLTKACRPLPTFHCQSAHSPACTGLL